MLFQMRFRTLFTLLLSLIAPAGYASANMRFNFENCYILSLFNCIGFSNVGFSNVGETDTGTGCGSSKIT